MEARRDSFDIIKSACFSTVAARIARWFVHFLFLTLLSGAIHYDFSMIFVHAECIIIFSFFAVAIDDVVDAGDAENKQNGKNK